MVSNSKHVDANKKLAESVSKRVAERLREIVKSMGGGSVRVGFMEGATYPDGTPVAAVAFWNEFGHEGPFPAPPRPFFRNMISKESPTWPDKMGNLAKVTEYDGPRTLAIMGEDIVGALKESILDDALGPELSNTTLVLRNIYGNDPSSIRARDVLAAQELVVEWEKGLDGMDKFPGATGTQAKPLVWTGHMLNSITYEVKK